MSFHPVLPDEKTILEAVVVGLGNRLAQPSHQKSCTKVMTLTTASPLLLSLLPVSSRGRCISSLNKTSWKL